MASRSWRSLIPTKSSDACRSSRIRSRQSRASSCPTTPRDLPRRMHSYNISARVRRTKQCLTIGQWTGRTFWPPILSRTSSSSSASVRMLKPICRSAPPTPSPPASPAAVVARCSARRSTPPSSTICVTLCGSYHCRFGSRRCWRWL